MATFRLSERSRQSLKRQHPTFHCRTVPASNATTRAANKPPSALELLCYEKSASLQVDGNIGGWLYRTATNLGIDALRASGRRRQYEEAAGTAENERGTGGPLDDLLREEQCRRVRAVLASIKPAQAQPLILRSSGLSYKELAEALNVKMSGIGTMLNRAEEEFRDRYLALHPNKEEL